MRYYEPNPKDAMMVRLFGYIADSSHPMIEDIEMAIYETEEKDIAAYCFEKGVDILRRDGEPVYGYGEIAVLLKAIDGRIMKPGRKSLIRKRKPDDPVLRAEDYLPDEENLDPGYKPPRPKWWHYMIKHDHANH